MDTIEKKFCDNLKLWLEQQPRGAAARLAESLKVPQGSISNMAACRRPGTESQRRAIAKKIGLSYEYMIGMDDSIEPTKQNQSITVKIHTIKDKAILEETAPNYRSVPLYESGRLAAWSNGAAFDKYEEATSRVIVYLPELKHHANHNLIAARVGGDSMEPLIPEGSIVIIDLDDREFADNKIFAITQTEGDVDVAAVKRVRKFEEAKGFILLSENQNWSPRLVIESDWLRLCMGRVIWMWRSFEG